MHSVPLAYVCVMRICTSYICYNGAKAFVCVYVHDPFQSSECCIAKFGMDIQWITGMTVGSNLVIKNT